MRLLLVMETVTKASSWLTSLRRMRFWSHVSPLPFHRAAAILAALWLRSAGVCFACLALAITAAASVSILVMGLSYRACAGLSPLGHDLDTRPAVQSQVAADERLQLRCLRRRFFDPDAPAGVAF